MNEKYSALFTPWKIGNVEIKNRIVQPSMGGTSLFGWLEPCHFDKEAAYHILNRAQNNVGLVLPGMQCVRDAMGGRWLYQNKKMFKDLAEWLPEFHKTGSKLFIQLAAGFGRSMAVAPWMVTLNNNKVLGALANQILNNFDATKIFGLVNSLSDMLVTDMSVQDIVSTVNAMRGMDVDGIYSANLPSYADGSTMIDGVSYVFVYEDELKEMMARVEAGEDPKGPNTMGLSDGSSSTIGDLNNNTSEDYAYGTATSSGGSDDSDDSGDGSDNYEEPTGDGNGYEANY